MTDATPDQPETPNAKPARTRTPLPTGTRLARRAWRLIAVGLALIVIATVTLLLDLAAVYKPQAHPILTLLEVLGIAAVVLGVVQAVRAIRERGALTRRGYVNIYVAWLGTFASIVILALSYWLIPFFLGTWS